MLSPTFSGLPVCCDTAHSSICIHYITSLCCWSPCKETHTFTNTNQQGLRNLSVKISNSSFSPWLSISGEHKRLISLSMDEHRVTWDSEWWRCSAPHPPTDPGSPRLYCSPAVQVKTFQKRFCNAAFWTDEGPPGKHVKHCVSLTSNKCVKCISLLIKHFQSWCLSILNPALM